MIYINAQWRIRSEIGAAVNHILEERIDEVQATPGRGGIGGPMRQLAEPRWVGRGFHGSVGLAFAAWLRRCPDAPERSTVVEAVARIEAAVARLERLGRATAGGGERPTDFGVGQAEKPESSV